MTFRVAALIAVSSLTLAPTAQAADSGIYTFGTTVQGAENYHGAIFDANARFRLSRSFELNPGIRRLERSYGDTKFEEMTGYLGLVHKMGRGFYAVHELAATPKAIINPEWSYLAQLHSAYGKNDVGLNLGYAKYYNLNSGSLGPNFYHAFNSTYAMSTGMTFARTDRWLSSALVQAIFTPWKRTEGRLVYAGGETLEAAGLQARFQSLTAEALIAVSRRVRVGVGATTYKSTRRKEDSALLKLEVR